jgi:hypothetical protein
MIDHRKSAKTEDRDFIGIRRKGNPNKEVSPIRETRDKGATSVLSLVRKGGAE